MTAVRSHTRNPPLSHQPDEVVMDITVSWSRPTVDPLLYRVFVRNGALPFIFLPTTANITVPGVSTSRGRMEEDGAGWRRSS